MVVKFVPWLAAAAIVVGMAWSVATALGQATAPCSLAGQASSAMQARVQASCVYASQDAQALAGNRRWHVSVAANACVKQVGSGSVYACVAAVRFGRKHVTQCQWAGTLRGRSRYPARLRLLARGMVC
jgi:hypothetical protein